MEKGVKPILILFLIVLIFYLFIQLSAILVPLVLAIFTASLFVPVIHKLEKFKVPKKLFIPILSAVVLIFLFILFYVVFHSISEIGTELPFLTTKIVEKTTKALEMINSTFSLSIDFTALKEGLVDLLNKGIVARTAGSVAKKVSQFAGSFFMFSLYFVVLLSGITNYKNFTKQLEKTLPDSDISGSIDTVRKSIVSYVSIKSGISLLTGVVTWIVLAIFGLKFAFLFAMMTFLLNFIPSIGSIIAVVPPILIALIQFDSLVQPTAIFALLLGLQMTMGNIIEPKVMGNKLRLNTLSVIFGLVLWGYIWGIPGMLLSVPMMVLLKLIFDRIESLRFISVILGSGDE